VAAGKATTREDLLDAGIRLYRRMSGNLLKGLTSGKVATEAGYHRQTFYRYWDTQAEYVDDLIGHVLTEGSVDADGLAVLPARRNAPDDPVELLRDIARYDFARTSQDAASFMKIGLVCMQATDGDDEGGIAVEAQEASVRRLADAMEQLLAQWHREPVPPLTCRDLVRVQQALLSGLLVQDRNQDGGPGPEALYEEVFGRIVQSLTRPT
jgi:AcrR family transcriptional regulator